jgi:PadR family transcriptional regulator, regulatory protein PadR
MLILKTLSAAKEMHGFQIADYIQENTESVLSVEEGSLYPALQRLLMQGWVTAEWGRTEGNRRARYYRLTPAGRKQLERENGAVLPADPRHRPHPAARLRRNYAYR